MGNKYPQEFKDEAIRQGIDNGYSIKDVANRLGFTDKFYITGLIKPINRKNRIKEVKS